MRTKTVNAAAVREFHELSRLLESADLSLPELLKRPGRWSVFRDKMDRQRPFTLKTSTGEILVTISPTENAGLYDALTKEDGTLYKDAFRTGVVVRDAAGAAHSIFSPSDLRKDGEFGGRGAGSSTSAESSQISQIDSAIAEVLASEGEESIDIALGAYVARGVASCKSVPSNPKADAALNDSDGSPVAFISLKYANSPKEMNQWSGISKFADHEEVKKFACDLRGLHADGVPSGKVYYREVDDDSLKSAAVWGSGATRSKDLADAVIATRGRIGLKKVGKYYEFTVSQSGGVWFPESPPSYEWEPALVARKGDRADLGVPKTRIGVFPKGYRGGLPLPEDPNCRSGSAGISPVATPIEGPRSKLGGKKKSPPANVGKVSKPAKPKQPPLDPNLGESVTTTTRLLLEELFPRVSLLERYGITESYVTEVLGLPRPTLVEGRISEREIRVIIREHLIFESWWEKAKEVVGSGIAAVKEKGESAAGVLKKYGEDLKGVTAALWASASDPNSLAELLKKFKSKLVEKSNETVKFIGDVLTRMGKSLKADSVTGSLKECLEFVKKVVSGLSSLTGWKGMMATAAGFLGFEWLAEKISPLEKKISELLKGSASEEVSALVQTEVIDFITNKLVEIGGEFAVSAIEQLAGPAAWLNSAFTVFEKSSWVLDKLSSVIGSSTNDFEEAPAV